MWTRDRGCCKQDAEAQLIRLSLCLVIVVLVLFYLSFLAYAD